MTGDTHPGTARGPRAGGPPGSHDSTLEPIVRGTAGDREAVGVLLERCLPPLRRWSHSRLPAYARGHLDTGDIVRDVAMQVVQHLESFEPRDVGAAARRSRSRDGRR